MFLALNWKLSCLGTDFALMLLILNQLSYTDSDIIKLPTIFSCGTGSTKHSYLCKTAIEGLEVINPN